MSKTQQKLEDAIHKKECLQAKRDKISKEMAAIGSTIISLEKQLEREKINDGITRIQASGISIDEIITLLEKEKLEVEKAEGEM